MGTAASYLQAIFEDGSTKILAGCGCLHSVMINSLDGSCYPIVTFDLIRNVEITAERVHLEETRVTFTRDDYQSILLITSASGSPETGALRAAVDLVVDGSFSDEVKSLPKSTMAKLMALVRSVGSISPGDDRSSKSADEAEETATGNVGNARISLYLHTGDDMTAPTPTQGIC